MGYCCSKLFHAEEAKVELNNKVKDENEITMTIKSDDNEISPMVIDSLFFHNKKRLIHGVNQLILSKRLCSSAQKWAKYLSKQDIIENSSKQIDNKHIGESILMFSGKDLSGKELIDIWYNEKENYNFNNPLIDYTNEHFTQMIWRDTKEFGLGVSKSNTGNTYIVANYLPAGNIEGEEVENIFPIISNN